MTAHRTRCARAGGGTGRPLRRRALRDLARGCTLRRRVRRRSLSFHAERSQRLRIKLTRLRQILRLLEAPQRALRHRTHLTVDLCQRRAPCSRAPAARSVRAPDRVARRTRSPADCLSRCDRGSTWCSSLDAPRPSGRLGSNNSCRPDEAVFDLDASLPPAAVAPAIANAARVYYAAFGHLSGAPDRKASLLGAELLDEHRFEQIRRIRFQQYNPTCDVGEKKVGART